MISSEKKRFFTLKLLGIIFRLSAMLCMMYIVYAWISQTSTISTRKYNVSRFTNIFPLLQNPKEFTGVERRIAWHFVMDTLPGLMQHGLIKKYERRQSGTLLYVTGKIWKERSKFFKESLLAEIMVYNKVNGHATDIRIVDHYSQRLYAQASSSEIKEFFD
jgi:hypothetical protein